MQDYRFGVVEEPARIVRFIVSRARGVPETPDDTARGEGHMNLPFAARHKNTERINASSSVS
jgi:hypothetical protein